MSTASEETADPVGSLSGFLNGLAASEWVDLVTLKTVDKLSAVARGGAIADDIAEVFSAPMPLHSAAIARRWSG